MEASIRATLIGSWTGCCDRRGQVLRSPFSRHIMSLPCAPNKKVPDHLLTYDRNIDPREFLQTFRATMYTRDFTDEEICKIVPSYLRGKALNWFNQTKSESLFCYWDFGKFLLGSFFNKKKFTRTMSDTVDEKQRPGEDTEAFYHRFVDICLECVDRTETMIILPFRQNINDLGLVRKLCAKEPRTLQHLQSIVEKYCRCEGGRET